MLPVALAAIAPRFAPDDRNAPVGPIEGLRLLGIFLAVYALATPSSLLEPFATLDGMAKVRMIYSSWWFGYTLPAGSPALLHLGRYLAWVSLSHDPRLAVALFGMALLGAGALLAGNRPAAAVVLAFPIAYLGFFFQYRVLLVRNLLPLVPYCALLAAHGLTAAIRAMPRPALRAVAVAAVVAAIGLDAAWLVRAARSIGRPTAAFLDEAVAEVRDHPGTVYLISRQLHAEGGSRFELPNARFDAAARFDRALFYLDEAGDRYRWIAWHRDLVDRWFGPSEVNLNYYPSWQSFVDPKRDPNVPIDVRPRIVSMTAPRLAEQNVPPTRLTTAHP